MSKSTSSISTTDFKSKKQKIEAHQPSLKKYIEEVKQTGMKYFSSIIHMIKCEKCRLYLFSLTVPVIVPVAQFKNQITDSTQEQKSCQCTKKESPVYPPGKRGGCSG